MARAEASSWVVLKFGGTSVSSLPNWRNIAAVVRSRLGAGERVLLVHSALSGITDRLEALPAATRAGAGAALLAEIEQRHCALAAELGIEADAQLQRCFGSLREAAAGLTGAGPLDERAQARLLASGELMATAIGARYLQSQGLPALWWDARSGLRAEPRHGATGRAHFLSATCDYAPDAELRARLDALPGVIVTQGFIASDAAGDTVLLGRGGSDTSAAYFAAKLLARRLEIWTDVPGLFSANPRATPQARLLRSLHYDEAQEIASSGAKVLHPRCILPAKSQRIPIAIYATHVPHLEGTHVSADGGDGVAQVKAVCMKKGITLVSLESPGMWHEVGFLADAFQIFKRHGLSVDLVSTSETNVTVSLDPAANSLDQAQLERLERELSALCRVQVLGPCASVSLVGRNIRAILHQLGDAFELFAEQRVYLLSQAANDLNFSFVVDEEQGERLVNELHERLIRPVRAGSILGPTWEQLFRRAQEPPAGPGAWWRARRAQLLELAGEHECAFVYEPAVIRARARALRALPSVQRVLYAMKANPNRDILRLLAQEGLAFECVSRGEVEHLLESVPRLERGQILFTPNFAGREEYRWALDAGVDVTIDNLYVLQHWGELFRGRSVCIRIDCGTGRGHHPHVRTAGTYAKFGIPLSEVGALQSLLDAHGVEVHGLHTHAGSGVFNPGSWSEVASCLLALAAQFPRLRMIDVGGGLGVPDGHDQPELDLRALDAALLEACRGHPAIGLWLEPGRYLVAESGVLIARVTQTKAKEEMRYIGICTGMNSLIRPALYGAWHEIVNLTRLEEPASEVASIVGPICESADFLGHDRLLPPTRAGDVLLIANAGAYGRAMSSRYNLREPAIDILLS